MKTIKTFNELYKKLTKFKFIESVKLKFKKNKYNAIEIINKFREYGYNIIMMLKKEEDIDCIELLNKDIIYKLDVRGKIINKLNELDICVFDIQKIDYTKMKFCIGQELENVLNIIRDEISDIRDESIVNEWSKITQQCDRMLPIIRILCYKIYMFNKNAEIELNFFFKNYTKKEMLNKFPWEKGKAEQFGWQSTDILK